MSENSLSVEGDINRYVYLDQVKINYEELEKYRTFVHLVEDEEGIGIVLTVASNSLFAVMKVKNQGYSVIQTVTLLQIFEVMATQGVGTMLDTDEEGS